ncbi:MAG: helix-turn-helix domain-containing protein [Amphiplicatus sp.]
MDVADRLAVNLQRLRREKGWSQEDLAEESGLHRTYVSGIERRKRNPTITVVDRLAVALKVPMGALLDAPPRPGSRPIRSKMRRPSP